MESLLDVVSDSAVSVIVLSTWVLSLSREKKFLLDQLVECVRENRKLK